MCNLNKVVFLVSIVIKFGNINILIVDIVISGFILSFWVVVIVIRIGSRYNGVLLIRFRIW